MALGETLLITKWVSLGSFTKLNKKVLKIIDKFRVDSSFSRVQSNNLYSASKPRVNLEYPTIN